MERSKKRRTYYLVPNAITHTATSAPPHPQIAALCREVKWGRRQQEVRTRDRGISGENKRRGLCRRTYFCCLLLLTPIMRPDPPPRDHAARPPLDGAPDPPELLAPPAPRLPPAHRHHPSPPSPHSLPRLFPDDAITGSRMLCKIGRAS